MPVGESLADYRRYIRSSSWRNKAKSRMEMDGRTCCVCGQEATEVHHMTYDNFRHERMEDLVSLCHRCHKKAEELYDPGIIPWALDKANCFMAAMHTDAGRIAPEVYSYLKEVRGKGFYALMELRRPKDKDGKKYWSALKQAVMALCRKRYAFNCAEDRASLMIESISAHIAVIFLSQIEHSIRNMVQGELHEIAMTEYMVHGKWKDVAECLGISMGTLSTLRGNDGSTIGPLLRDVVFYYCSLDAAAGFDPPDSFISLTDEDYTQLRHQAEYVRRRNHI